MLNGFDWQWVIFVPATYITIFVFLILLNTLFKKKISNLEQISTTSSSLLPTITTICLACAVPILGIFGIFLDFPPIIIALLLGSASYSISDLIIKFLEKKGKTFTMHIFIINTLLITSGTLVLFLLYGGGEKELLNPDMHSHADLKVYANYNEIILYKNGNIEKDKYVHFHDGEYEENVIHIEGKGQVTLNDFFKTLHFNLNQECKSGFAREGEPIFSYYVNGLPSGQDIDRYVIKDLDKLLVVCRSNVTQEMIDSVRNYACVQSKKC